MHHWRPERVVWLAFLVTSLGLGAAAAAASPATPDQDVPEGHIQVQGRILYIDRNSDRSHPAGGLRIEIWDQDYRSFTTGEKLGETQTDAAGFFTSAAIRNIDPDGPTGQLEGGQDVFLKLFTNNGTIRVLDLGSREDYVWESYNVDERDGLLRNVDDGIVAMPPLYVMENTRDVEALWTYVNLVDGWRYVKEQTGQDPGPVTALWSETSKEGPRYDADEQVIYLRDADAGYASLVVQQEAYALLHNLYGTLPEGWADCTAGPLGGLKSIGDPACAFAGGFATFFATAVAGDPRFETLELRSLDLDAQAADSAGWSAGADVAGRVAGALWDLHEGDESEEPFDKYNATFADIWTVLSATHPETMQDWWDGWLAAGMDGCAPLGSLYQNTIDYNTPPQVTPIDTVTLDEDTETAIDLADYVTDLECDDDQLQFAIVDSGVAEAGVQRVGTTSVISITPEANWFGETIVRYTASDGPATVEETFRVVVTSVNDCPTIDERIASQQAQYDTPIVLDLANHASDIETAASQLTWRAELEPADQSIVEVHGQDTQTLTFTLNPLVTERRTVRAELIVSDGQGCETSQPVSLTWTRRPNYPPFIRWDRFTEEYVAAMNQNITVDLTGVAGDDEDGPDDLEWFVLAETLEHAQWGYASPDTKQTLVFEPDVGYIGSDLVELEVRDSAGAAVTAAITLTWQDPAVFNNLPPRILRNKLLGKTVGTNATACYPLTEKAEDPDDPQRSLQWFVVDFAPSNLTVTGQGSRELCLTPRYNFEGCMTTDFVVHDPKGAEDSHEVTTCWRTIAIRLPYVTKPRSR